jgi:hypothetical protein
MNRTLIGAATLVVVAFGASCEKEKTPEPVAPKASATAAATAASPPPAAPLADNIPVAADFEEEAEKTITKANYKTELDSLEAELKQ